MKEITEDKGRIRPVVEGDFQCDENGNSTRFYEILSIVGIVDNNGKLSYISKKDVPIGIPITNEEYWYPFQVIAVPKGDKGNDGKSAYDLYVEHGGTITTVDEWLESLHGADGKDAINPILRISHDGLSIEISSDNGHTWLPFQKDFNKLRILGYLESVAQLPVSANIGDIYGVWNQDAQSGVGAYELYVQTVRDWVEDYTITKVYDYDTELPSSATDGTAVLVPVTDLTLDKEKIDGYKVYKFNLATNGWILVLNTAEIYANKEDIINYGDNVYALVQGATEGTYELYKRSVGWVKFGTNASITYHLIQDIQDGTETNVPSGKAVKDSVNGEATLREQAINDVNVAISELDTRTTENLDSFKQEVKDTYGVNTENPEFVRAVLDNEDKILYGVQKDGNFYFGAGCPQQVKDYVQQKIDTIIGVGDITEKIDTINEMIAFFDEISHDTALKELLAASAQAVTEEKERAEAAEQHLDDVKVNKEEGKSLINAEYAEGVHYIESPEFAEIKLDAEQRILEATYKDGTKLFPAGFRVNGVAEYDGATVTTISNPEFVAVWVDNSNRILLGIKSDANIFFGYGVPSQIKDYIDEEIYKVSPEGVHEIIAFIGEYLGSATLQELLSKKVDGEYTENVEYVEVKVDSNDKIIEATREDGTKVFPAGIETPKANFEGTIIENAANPEYAEIKVDAKNKLLEGTKTDGTKVIGGNLEISNDLNIKGDVEVGGNVSYKNGIPQAIIDYVAANTGSGVTNIEYEDETGDMYATFDDADGVTNVYMEENGDIYAEIEE